MSTKYHDGCEHCLSAGGHHKKSKPSRENYCPRCGLTRITGPQDLSRHNYSWPRPFGRGDKVDRVCGPCEKELKGSRAGIPIFTKSLRP